MRIATWNINSVRRRLPLVVDWLAANKPDVLCLQETKVPDGEFPAAAFIDAGYHVAFRGMKGYNGVATLTRREPESVFYGFCAGPDSEDVRILETVVDGIPIVKTYVPQGYKIGTDKYVFKLEWFHRVRRYFSERLDPTKPPLRTGELQRGLEEVSPKMLTQTLRGMECDGLVRRKIYTVVPPRVEYDLTEMGRALLKPLQDLCTWAKAHVPERDAARRAYDAAAQRSLSGTRSTGRGRR
jgi:exonuclease III